MAAEGFENYDFGVNKDQIADLTTELDNAQQQLKALRKDIFSLLGENGLGKHWTGTAYDTFYANCLKYKDSMKMLENFIKAYSNLFSKNVTEAYDVLSEDLAKAFNVEG